MSEINEYREWLWTLVGEPSPRYSQLFSIGWHTDFIYYIPNDQNRAQDGIALRGYFETETSIRLPDLGECKMIEFLIALSRRMNDILYDFRDPNRTADYFWELIDNIDLTIDYEPPIEYEEDIIRAFHIINHREYDRWGNGGSLFPLRKPYKDQRKTEIWYQMMAYLQENYV